MRKKLFIGPVFAAALPWKETTMHERISGWLVAVCATMAASALAAELPNLLPNGSFEMVEPPPPTPEQVAKGLSAPPDTWLPRTWDIRPTNAL